MYAYMYITNIYNKLLQYLDLFLMFLINIWLIFVLAIGQINIIYCTIKVHKWA